jgi:hypothetical protein
MVRPTYRRAFIFVGGLTTIALLSFESAFGYLTIFIKHISGRKVGVIKGWAVAFE